MCDKEIEGLLRDVGQRIANRGREELEEMHVAVEIGIAHHEVHAFGQSTHEH